MVPDGLLASPTQHSRRFLLIIFLVMISVMAAAASPSGTVDMEEMTVTAPRLERFEIPNVEFLVEAYDSRRRAGQLYREQKYKEAFPLLLASSRRGFKLAQARLGYLYLAGLGTERDSETGVVWLGVAARASTAPEIRNYFKSIWRGIPEGDIDYLNERIDDFDKRYGARANRVACNYATTTKSRIKKLYCRYMDQCRFVLSEAAPELLDCPQRY